MKDVVVPSGGEEGKVALPKAKAVKIVLKKKAAPILELKDVFFHDGSAVMLPSDPAGPPDDKKKVYSSLEIIKAAFVYMRENPKKRLIITGHTDKAGGETKDNFELSKLMANGVYALIKGIRAGWIQAVKNACNVEDHKYIIKYCFGKYKLGQDPGAINSTVDDKSKKAVKKFKRDYNKVFGMMLTVDENINDEFWGAVYEVYQKELAELLGARDADDMVNFRKNIAFVVKDDESKNIFGCAESISLDLANVTGLKSKKQGRVILFFFDSDKMTAHNIKCSDKTDSPHKVKRCPFYNKTIKAAVLDPAEIFGKGPIITITKLDKWFIPGPTGAGKDGEECEIEIEIGGRKGMATQLVMDVYGNNYCEAKVNKKGFVSFKKLTPEIPVFHARRKEKVESGKKYKIEKWNGTSNAKKGMLKPRDKKTRYINVAFSPYTVHFRYYKDDADKEARLELLDFWPQWEKDGVNWKPVNDSLKIKWKISKYKKLKFGELVIFDRTDNKVFIKELKEADLSEGDHDFQWDGKLKDATKMKKSEMPYRVQIHGHSDGEEPKGVALAAMHTEIRLYADPDTNKNAKPDEYKDPNSLEFSLADFVTARPNKDREENKWYQYVLALSGFHPGPISGKFGSDTKKAIREFQRAIPENTVKPFARLSITGGKNNKTKAALLRYAPPDMGPALPPLRALFGNPEDANLADLTTADSITRLNDKSKEIIAWVDGRHYYTKPNDNALFWKDATYKYRAMFMGNYRDTMTIGDGIVAKDKASICRPWLPLAVDLPLRPRDTTNKGLNSKENKFNSTSRKAVGPLRVDWSFRETGEDLSTLTGVGGNPKYGATDRIRTRTWVKNRTDNYADTQDGLKYTNCPAKYKIGTKMRTIGGLRPVKKADNGTDLDKYYKLLFGRGKSSLFPWKVIVDKDKKKVYTLVHDDFQQDEKEVHVNFIGKAGLYLRPSIIAGDGYRFRARVSFEKFPGKASQFPNQEVLKKRYEKLPQAHTSKVRIWRKTAYRGYAPWIVAGKKKWPGNIAGCSEFYRSSHIHFVHDNGASSAPGVATEYPMNNLISGPDYTALLNKKVTVLPYKNYTVTYINTTIWPYSTVKRLGIPRSGYGVTLENFYKKVYNAMFNATWRTYRDDLLYFLIKKVEIDYGKLKGHFLVDFESSGKVDLIEYKCDVCNKTRVEAANNCTVAETLKDKNCTSGACGGVLRKNRWYTPANQPKIPLPAVGVAVGGTWLFPSNADIWAHELGHHRHLEHAQSRPGSADTAPGAKNKQHDSQTNTHEAWVVADLPKDRCWDRRCIMSYNHGEALYFCGKCVAKNRGWGVERIVNPGGGVHD